MLYGYVLEVNTDCGQSAILSPSFATMEKPVQGDHSLGGSMVNRETQSHPLFQASKTRTLLRHLRMTITKVIYQGSSNLGGLVRTVIGKETLRTPVSFCKHSG